MCFSLNFLTNSLSRLAQAILVMRSNNYNNKGDGQKMSMCVFVVVLKSTCPIVRQSPKTDTIVVVVVCEETI